MQRGFGDDREYQMSQRWKHGCGIIVLDGPGADRAEPETNNRSGGDSNMRYVNNYGLQVGAGPGARSRSDVQCGLARQNTCDGDDGGSGDCGKGDAIAPGGDCQVCVEVHGSTGLASTC
jgi:hypothetical protein